MAIVAGGFFLNVTVIDRQNDSITLSYELQSADYATALVDAATILAALDGVSSANVAGYNILSRFFEDALTVPAVGDNSIKGRISARKTDGYAATIDIPAPLEAIFVGATGANNNIVDLADPAVSAYVDLFKAGAEAFVSDGEVFGAGEGIKGQRVTVGRGFR